MPAFENDEFHWRETYFVLFESRRRPTLAQVQKALGRKSQKYELRDLMADPKGQFESLTLLSPDDNAALEISYESGELVVEQAQETARQVRSEAAPEQAAVLARADARLDVMHFEHMSQESIAPQSDDDEEFDETLDPSCLLSVVETLVRLTGGVPIDPASGAIMP